MDRLPTAVVSFSTAAMFFANAKAQEEKAGRTSYL